MSESGGEFEVVIGLEVHAHLRTKSKLFSPAPILYGAEPNHSVHPICLALPGVLPVLNEHAVELAILLLQATQAEREHGKRDDPQFTIGGSYNRHVNRYFGVGVMIDWVAEGQILALATMRNIRQNLFFAFVYNIAGVPIAAGILYPFFGLLLSPMIAAAAMSLSSVSVIGNALRLRHVQL